MSWIRRIGSDARTVTQWLLAWRGGSAAQCHGAVAGFFLRRMKGMAGMKRMSSFPNLEGNGVLADLFNGPLGRGIGSPLKTHKMLRAVADYSSRPSPPSICIPFIRLQNWPWRLNRPLTGHQNPNPQVSTNHYPRPIAGNPKGGFHLVVEDSHRAGPARRSPVHLYREAHDIEPMRR